MGCVRSPGRNRVPRLMYTVYVLKSRKIARTYVGFTSDINKRLADHNNGRVSATKAHRPWVIVYTEECESLASAKNRELYWKRGGGRRLLGLIQNGSPPLLKKRGGARSNFI